MSFPQIIGIVLLVILVNTVSFIVGFKKGFRYFYRCISGDDLQIHVTLLEVFMRRQRKKEPAKMLDQRRWQALWSLACDKARETGDPRLSLLERYSSEPEKILRKMSIISVADIDRELK